MSAMAQQQSSRPPRDLHRVGDHWTAYNPPDPATYPAGAKTHTIAAGDTLWGLATQYYGNGYLWPQLRSEERRVGKEGGSGGEAAWVETRTRKGGVRGRVG